MQREVIDTLKRDLGRLEQEHRAAVQHLQRQKQLLSIHNNQEHELFVESQRAEDRADDLKDAIDRDRNQDGRLEALTSALREAEEELKLHERSFEDCVNARDAATTKVKEIKRELAAKDTEISRFSEDTRQAENELSVKANKRHTALVGKNDAIAKTDTAKAQVTQIERKQEDTAARIADFIQKASMVSPRVPIDAGETETSLAEKLERLDRDLRRYDSQYVRPIPRSYNLLLTVVLGWGRQGRKLPPPRRKLMQNMSGHRMRSSVLEHWLRYGVIIYFSRPYLIFFAWLLTRGRCSKVLWFIGKKDGRSFELTLRHERRSSSSTFSVSEASEEDCLQTTRRNY